jgi:hypothetical protein
VTVLRYPTVEAIAYAAYPNYKWDPKKFLSVGSFTPQSLLERMVKSLFPTCIVSSNARKIIGIRSPKGNFLEIDVFLADHCLGFEFQVISFFFCFFSISFF